MTVRNALAVDSYAALARVFASYKKEWLAVFKKNLLYKPFMLFVFTVGKVYKYVRVFKLELSSNRLKFLLELLYFNGLYGILHFLYFNFHNLAILKG